MIRKIIRIDEEKCNGCGACAAACHEGAIEMIDGKAKLTREDYCDGLGDCLPGFDSAKSTAAWTFGSMLPGAKCPSAMYCFASSTVMSSSHFSSGFP